MAKHRKKSKIPKILLGILKYLVIIILSMVIGAVAYSVVEFHDVYTQSDSSNQTVKKKISPQIKKNNNTGITNESYSDLLKLRRQAQNANVRSSGRVIIKDLSINLPIYPNTNKYTLAMGATVYLSNPNNMGKDNYILAGHNVQMSNALFSNLLQAKIGQTVELRKGSQRYKYKINKIETIAPTITFINGQPDKLSLFNLKPEEPLVTLFACAHSGSQRRVVQGKLIA